MKNGINTIDLKTNIVSTVVSTVVAVIVAFVVGTLMANSMKSAYANQTFPHQAPAVVQAAADTDNDADTKVSACSIPESAKTVHHGVLSQAHHKVSVKKASHSSKNVTHTTTTNNNQSVSNGNVTNNGRDNDLVDIDDLVDVNAPVNANVLNNSLNNNSVLNDVLDVRDNDLDLNILSNIL